MAGPFKMKGSPMARNFGIGSPVREIIPKGFGGKGYSNPQKGLHIQDYKPTIEGRHSEMLRKTTNQSSKVSRFIKGAKKVGGKVLKVGSKVIAPIAVATTLYDMYKSGQKHSGGKIGYIQNPNYKKGGGKFGDQDSTSQFMPKKKGQKHTSIWDNNKNTNSSTNKGINYNKGKQ